METVVVNRDEGQEVRLQGFCAPSIGGVADLIGAGVGTTLGQHTATLETLAELNDTVDYEIPVRAAHLWAVELGAGITRDPRP